VKVDLAFVALLVTAIVAVVVPLRRRRDAGPAGPDDGKDVDSADRGPEDEPSRYPGDG
jgi:hypothetical protein